jgi:hypothetical protein
MTLLDAISAISVRTPIGSVLRSADWRRVPLALRETAQFSAGVESARVLQTIQDRLASQLRGLRETLPPPVKSVQSVESVQSVTATFDRSSFIDSLRALARSEGLTPTDLAIRGTIQDITSIPRLGLIYDIQTARAQEYARWKLDQSEGALDLYPAQQLTRIEDRRTHRDWATRWQTAGASVDWEGALRAPMIALKTSPIWRALSRFDTPWPPFDFGSGMGLEDIDRDRAIALGLLTEDTQLDPLPDTFTEELEASVTNLDPALIDRLKSHFGDQIQITNGRAQWRAAA